MEEYAAGQNGTTILSRWFAVMNVEDSESDPLFRAFVTRRNVSVGCVFKRSSSSTEL